MSKSTAAAVVRAFCKAWEDRDVEAILATLDDAVVFQNVPAPAVHGLAATRDFILPIIRETIAIDFELLALAVNEHGDTVLTERLDRLHYPSGVVEIPVMGVFVVRNETIVEWRDYSDFASIGEAFKRVGVSLGSA